MNKLSKILLVIIMGISIALGILMWRYTVDDSFISYRYSKNLSDGAGIVWNKGEKPVEGYTNFLWVIILAVFIKLGIDPVAASKVLGLLMLAGTGVLGYFMGLKLLERKNPFLALVPVLIFSINASFIIHAISGLETMMFCFILMAITYLSLEVKENATKSAMAMLYSSFFISGLIRPEGVLFSAVILAVLMAIKPEARSAGSLKLIMLCFILPGIMYMAWRFSYFGYLLPNTYYIKGDMGNIIIGWEYVRSFIFKTNYMFMLLLLACAVLVRGSKKYLFIIPTLVFLLFYVTVEPLMGFCFRYLVPVYPFMIIPVMLLAEKFIWRNNKMDKFRIAVVTAACLGLLYFPLKDFKGIMGLVRDYSMGLNKVHIRFGKILNGAVTGNPEKYTLAVGDAGAIPFYSCFRTIDTIGLNDVTIARKGFDAGYVFDNKPDVMMLYSEDGRTASPVMGSGYDYAIFSHPGMSNYDLRGVLQFGKDYYLLCYFRKDMPGYETVLGNIASEYQ